MKLLKLFSLSQTGLMDDEDMASVFVLLDEM